MRYARIFATAALVALAVAPAVSAQVPISARAIAASPAALTFDTAGTAFVAWDGYRGSVPDNEVRYAALASAAGGGWTAGPALPESVWSTRLASYAPGTAAVVTWRQVPLSPKRSRSLVVLSLWRAPGPSFMRSYKLYVGQPTRTTYEGMSPTILGPPQVGASARGDVVIAWERSAPRGKAGVYVAERGLGKRPTAARRLGPAGGEPHLAIAADGSGVLAWRRGTRILSRVRSADGRWGPTQVAMLAAHRYATTEWLGVAAANGRFAVATVDTYRSAAGVQLRVEASTRTTAGNWRTVQLGMYTFHAEAQTAYVVSHLRAVPVITADGRVRVLWPAQVDGTVRAALSELLPGADAVTAGRPQLLSDPARNVAIEDAAAHSDGSVAALWYDWADNTGSPSLAVVDSAGTVQTHAHIAHESAFVGAIVGYNPASGQPLAVWGEASIPNQTHVVSWTP